MDVLFTHQFYKQIQKIKDKHLAKNIADVILEVKRASHLSEIKNIKKLKGSSSAYRIRLGDYRIACISAEALLNFHAS